MVSLITSPFVRFGIMYSQAAEKRPFTVGVITTGVKTSAADLFAQMVRTSAQHCSLIHAFASPVGTSSCLTAAQCWHPAGKGPQVTNTPVCVQVMERRTFEEIDVKRHAAFCIFGFAYLASPH